MASYDLTRLRTVLLSTPLAIAATAGALSACSSGPATNTAAAAGEWIQKTVNAVSRPVGGSGVAAVTGLRKDGSLETVVTDVTNGKQLWSHPATMSGRIPGMGVQPPAIVGDTVTALEPGAQLVARNAKTGVQEWARPVGSTFGPVRCGGYVCLSEDTARKDEHFTVVDPATGKSLWQMPGIGEVEWSNAQRAVVFRMAQHPVLESHELSTGKTVWSYPVERAVGTGVNLSGGWSFGALGSAEDSVLVGYLAPYQEKRGTQLSAYGFFGLRISDGSQMWTRPRLLRLYPSAAPSVALITREVSEKGQYGGFAALDPRTGQTTSEISADKAPHGGWWLAFPADLSTLGFLSRDHKGAAYDLRRATAVDPRGLDAWSFCTITPAALPIKNQRGFYPVATLCAYDLATGKKVTTAGPPPGWYTGATDGWRLWRDESGALHGVHDAQGTAPGMYG